MPLTKNIYTFLFISYLCLASFNLLGQKSNKESKLKQAENYLVSFKNDSARTILDSLLIQLKNDQNLDSEFGLWVQFRQAESLEKDHQDEEALIRLLDVKEKSADKKVWDVYAKSSLILARLYEKIGKGDECLVHLVDCKSTIQSHENLENIYPLYAIRFSSYNRIFNNRDTALFYAQEALRGSQVFKQKPEEGVAHMLLGMLIKPNPPEKRLYHYKEAARIFNELNDYTGYSFMIGSVSGWYSERGEFEQALLYNDSMVASAQRSIDEGFNEHWHLSGAYKSRAEILKSQGKIESAWYFLQKGHEMDIEYVDERNNEKVLEIHAKYDDEKKAIEILEQSKQLKLERKNKNLLLGLLCIIGLFASILSYYYVRLRKSKIKTEVQAHQLRQSNSDLSNSLEQQKILQAEVHHRVKNNLEVIISLLDLQKEEMNDPISKEQLGAMSGRIYSMAAIHEILYNQKDMSEVNIYQYVNNLCTHFSNFSIQEDKPEFDLQISDQSLNIETCMPIGIILTELITNSLKYGRSEGNRLKIEIKLEDRAGDFTLTYNDNGPGFTEGSLKERKQGLGTYLLKSMVRQLDGELLTKNKNGARTVIGFKEKNKTNV